MRNRCSNSPTRQHSRSSSQYDLSSAPARGGRLRVSQIVVLLILIAAGGTAWAAFTGRLGLSKAKSVNYITEKVKKGPLEISITERGSLDSAANVTLVSKVEGTTTIIKIVEEGTTAKVDQVLVELDSSKLRDSETQQRIVVEQSDAALKQAIENRAIQATQNESDINAAQLKWTLAKLDYEQYVEGDYKNQLAELEGKKTLAEEELKRAQESYNFSKESAKKGYVTQSALEASRISVLQKYLAQDVANLSVDVLKKYTRERQVAEKEANKVEFEKELERVKRKASAAMTQAEANVSACRLTAEVENSKLEKLRQQIANCTLKAPQDGEVVYANTQSDRRGGSDAAVIQEGAQVRERQAIINLPDFSRMQVNAKVHESRIGFISEGLRCIVRTDAAQGELFNGVIFSVSSVPLSGSWPNRDLKEYATVVRLTDPVEKLRKLKPGLSAEVEVKVDYIPSCLYVPVQSAITIGGKQYAFPVINGVPETREIKIGKTNDINLEVKEGLNDGEDVLMNPRIVMSKEVARLEDLAREEEEKSKAEEAKNRKPGSPADSPRLDGPAGMGGPGAAGPGAGGPGGPGGPGGGNRPRREGSSERGPDGLAGGGPGGPGGPNGGRPGAVGAGGPGAGGPGAAGPGGAGSGGPGGGRGGFANMSPEDRFKRFDTNGDGKITEDEVPEERRALIMQSDADTDGIVTLDEFKANPPRFGGRGGPGGAPGGGPGAGGPGAGGPNAGGPGGRGAQGAAAATGSGPQANAGSTNSATATSNAAAPASNISSGVGGAQ